MNSEQRVLRNSPQANHRADTILRKFLRSLSLCSLSFESLLLESTKSLFVKIFAALYTKNMVNGGSRLKSIEFSPCVEISMVVVVVERTESRDSMALYWQSLLRLAM